MPRPPRDVEICPANPDVVDYGYEVRLPLDDWREVYAVLDSAYIKETVEDYADEVDEWIDPRISVHLDEAQLVEFWEAMATINIDLSEDVPRGMRRNEAAHNRLVEQLVAELDRDGYLDYKQGFLDAVRAVVNYDGATADEIEARAHEAILADRHCPNCGRYLTPEATGCGGCGVALTNEEEQEEEPDGEIG